MLHIKYLCSKNNHKNIVLLSFRRYHKKKIDVIYGGVNVSDVSWDFDVSIDKNKRRAFFFIAASIIKIETLNCKIRTNAAWRESCTCIFDLVDVKLNLVRKYPFILHNSIHKITDKPRLYIQFMRADYIFITQKLSGQFRFNLFT